MLQLNYKQGLLRISHLIVIIYIVVMSCFAIYNLDIDYAQHKEYTATNLLILDKEAFNKITKKDHTISDPEMLEKFKISYQFYNCIYINKLEAKKTETNFDHRCRNKIKIFLNNAGFKSYKETQTWRNFNNLNFSLFLDFFKRWYLLDIFKFIILPPLLLYFFVLYLTNPLIKSFKLTALIIVALFKYIRNGFLQK